MAEPDDLLTLCEKGCGAEVFTLSHHLIGTPCQFDVVPWSAEQLTLPENLKKSEREKVRREHAKVQVELPFRHSLAILHFDQAQYELVMPALRLKPKPGFYFQPHYFSCARDGYLNQ